jgi:SPX domain protein involved in polyphosphate accumulation
MGHIRDIRLRASEIKFLVSPDIAASIRIWARTCLDPDPHGAGPHRDEYHTTSVYFDTAAYDVFHRRGSFGRSKYRIRRYGEADSAFLERKMRGAIVLAKRRTSTSLATLERLTKADIDPDWPGYWFHRRVVARKLRPVCQVSYHRMARSVVINGDLVRLTLDSELQARPLDEVRFLRPSGTSITDGRAILELKFVGSAPTIFRSLVERFALNPQTASKYRLGLASIAGDANTVYGLRA